MVAKCLLLCLLYNVGLQRAWAAYKTLMNQSLKRTRGMFLDEVFPECH